MAYKTKAEKRAYKDGLFAALHRKGHARRKRRSVPTPPKKALETYSFRDRVGFGIDVEASSFKDAEQKAKKAYKKHYGWDLDLYKAVRKSDSAIKVYQ